MKHAVNWFKTPVQNFERAQSFCEHPFSTTLTLQETDDAGGKYCSHGCMAQFIDPESNKLTLHAQQ